MTKITIGKFCVQYGVDGEEILVRLWQQGYDHINDLSHVLSKSELGFLTNHYQILNQKNITRYTYWEDKLSKTRHEIDKYLIECGFKIKSNGVSVPKNSIRYLKAYSRTSQSERITPAQTKVSIPSTSTLRPAKIKLDWRIIGKERHDIAHLSSDDILKIHEELTKDFCSSEDPIDPPGVRSQSLLESTASRSSTSYGDSYKYPSVEMATAALVHSIVHNHPFNNGNKRSAIVAMLVMLDKNSCLLTCDDKELFKFVLQVAQHALFDTEYLRDSQEFVDAEVIEVAHWIKRNSRSISKSENLIPFRRLRRILSKYNCTFDHPERGNRINIHRDNPYRKSVFSKEPKKLNTQVYYSDEGSDVNINVIKKIRMDLRLDEQHGVDSESFYGGDAEIVCDFIQKYRVLLRKLARL